MANQIMIRKKPGQHLKNKPDGYLDLPDDSVTTEILISTIRPFKNHPYRVVDDGRMAELVTSIRENGVITPVLVRPAGLNTYEMISGHRRMHAAQLAGLKVLPAFIRELTDNEATELMVKANIQREEVLPSEKAFAYKMMLEAMKHQGKRSILEDKGTRKGFDAKGIPGGLTPYRRESAELLGEQLGESRAQIHRYIRLTGLVPDLLRLVDEKKLGITLAADVAAFRADVQQWIYDYIAAGGHITPITVTALKTRIEREPEMTAEQVFEQLGGQPSPQKPEKRKITITERRLKKYFPASYSSEEIEKVIYELLEAWKKENKAAKK